jgi:hypothetical protein
MRFELHALDLTNDRGPPRYLRASDASIHASRAIDHEPLLPDISSRRTDMTAAESATSVV